MSRLLIFIGMVGGGYVGWWAGDYFGLGLMKTFLASTLGSAIAVYFAWRITRAYSE